MNSTITWRKLADGLPDAETNVIVGLNVDGLKTSCEGFISADHLGNEQWYDVCAVPLEHEHVRCWADLPESPL